MSITAIEAALEQCDLFVSIGTSGAVYPAAGFVQSARMAGARTVEINLEPTQETLGKKVVRRQAGDVLAVHRHLAGGRLVDAGNDVEEVGFTGAVRAHQHVGLSSAHGQVDVVKNDLLIHSGRKACHVEEDVLVCHLLPLLNSYK